MAGIFIVLALVLMMLVIPIIGISYSFYFIWAIIGVFSLIPVLNYFGLIITSRIVLSLVIPLMTLLFSVVTKLEFTPHVSDFYDVRILILVSAIIPPIIFSSDEQPSMYAVLTIGLLITVFFDPIHDYFDVGYKDSGFDTNHYYIITIVSSIAFVFQVISILVLKRNVRLRDDEKENT